MTRLYCVGLAALLLFGNPPAFADEYPERPITIVVAFGVGGSADRMDPNPLNLFRGRRSASRCRSSTSAAPGTLIGSQFVLDQPHDGYTLLATGFSPYLSNTILEGNAAYTIDDFAYLNFQWFDEDLSRAQQGFGVPGPARPAERHSYSSENGARRRRQRFRRTPHGEAAARGQRHSPGEPQSRGVQQWWARQSGGCRPRRGLHHHQREGQREHPRIRAAAGYREPRGQR